MKVYISSTYQDLREYRAAAALGVRKLGFEAIGMETYRAREEPPLEVCLQDVRSADAYVGLFAWRVGFVPSGEREGITALEYREARKAGKRCFIFLLDESVAWPADQRDADPAAVRALRSELAETHTAMPFRTPDHLQAEVTVALAAGLTPRTSVPDLLPWLANRVSQEAELDKLLQRAREHDVARPYFIVLHGREGEGHNTFLRRLARHTLPQCLGCGERPLVVHDYVTPWSTSQSDLARREADLIYATEQVLRIPRGAEAGRVRVEWLARHRGPVLVVSTIHTHGWRPDEDRLIERWARWWGDWPEPPGDRPLVVALAVLYHGPAGFLDRLRLPRKQDRIRERLVEIAGGLGDRLHAQVLPELQPVDVNDLIHWIEHHVPRWLGEDRARTELLQQLHESTRALFRDPNGSEGRKLPMEVVGKHLHDALSSLLSKAA